MADARLLRRLDFVAARIGRLRMLRTLAIGWAILAAVVMVGVWAPELSPTLRILLLAAPPLILILGMFVARRTPGDRLRAARLIERTFPEFDARLITALQQRPHGSDWGFGYLQTELLTEVFTRFGKVDLRQTVPGRRLAAAHAAHLAALACLVFAVAVNFGEVAPAAGQIAQPGEAMASPMPEVAVIHVEPGNTEIERGTSVVVIARFEGPVPENVRLVSTNGLGESTSIPLKKSLNDPVFGGRVANVESNLEYHIEFDGRTSDDFTIGVFDYPALLRADANVTFPEYTGLEPKTIEDVRKLSVVEGAAVDLSCRWNKPIASAALVDGDGNRFPLVTTEGQPTVSALTWNAAEPGKNRFRLELIDLEGRANKTVPEFEISVVPNQPPDLKVSFPAKDVRVSPLQELAMSAEASDDFGLTTLGVVVETPDGAERTISLGDRAAANQRLTAEHLLPLEQLQAQPNDLVSYYFFAEDVGPDGQSRKTTSDIFFAEVRPFEEIFRQVPPQPGQQQQQQQQNQQQQGESGQLLELQRQIVTGSWNVLRREREGSTSAKFPEDVQVLLESQEQVRELAAEMAESVDDELMKQYAAAAIEHMGEAIEQFSSASGDRSVTRLRDARNSAQAAYRDLLRLQSREKNVQNSQSRSQSQGRAQNSQERMNQQLQALQLQNDRDRYETERQAQRQQEQAQQESLQVLNKLRELARRQEDLNEKIRELENALRNARTQEEREELERRLKRLQEEQQELLRDLDDVRERMNNETNRQRMADAREQVDQTRERVLRASEALQQGQTSRALTEGTRAERQLEQVKEELRQQTSGQFDQTVRQLRNDVQELAENEQRIADKLRGNDRPQESSRPTLRAEQPDNREEIAKDLNDQKARLTELLDRTRQLVEESETSEPLLSNKLYDAMRELRTFQPEESLENAARLTRYGVLPEAQKLEEQAREGINRLADGINDAARGILGNENEALQLAQAELNTLAESIRQELEQNQPEGNRPGRTPFPGTSDSAREAGSAGTQPKSPPDPTAPGDQPADANREAPGTPSPMDAAESARPGTSASPIPGERQPASGRRPPGSTGEQPSSPMDRSAEESPRPGTPGPSNEPTTPDRASQPSRPQAGPMPPQPGEQPEQTPGDSPSSEPSGQPGQPGRQPGQRSEQPSQGQPGDPQSGQRQSGGQRPGEQQTEGTSQPGQPSGERPSPSGQRTQSGGALAESLGNLWNEQGGDPNGGGAFGPHNPLTGEAFREWSDRLRDVEEMLSSPDLRARAAEIRDRARQVRTDVKRHSKQPNWELVRTSIYGPLVELEQLVAEELARRDPNERSVPIDRDPVPDRYADLVRKYYEELSRQRSRPAVAP